MSSAGPRRRPLAADWLTSAWDQNAGLYVCGPSVGRGGGGGGRAGWPSCSGCLPGRASAWSPGCQMAHVTALAAARHSVFARAGWDVGRAGPHRRPGGPRPRRRRAPHHRRSRAAAARVRRRLRDAGRRRRAGPDDPGGAGRRDRRGTPGRRSSARRPATSTRARSIDLDAIADIAEAAARGCTSTGPSACGRRPARRTATSSPGPSAPTRGPSTPTSGSTSRTTSGIAVLRRIPRPSRRRWASRASYLIHADPGGPRDALEWNPEFSRRARGFPVYAAIRSLGRSGVAELVERCCAHARRFAEALREPRRRRGAQRRRAQPGARPVPGPAGDHDAHTDAVIEAVQQRRCLLAERHDAGRACARCASRCRARPPPATMWTSRSTRSSARRRPRNPRPSPTRGQRREPRVSGEQVGDVVGELIRREL